MKKFVTMLMASAAVVAVAQEPAEEPVVSFTGGGYGESAYSRTFRSGDKGAFDYPHVDGWLEARFRKGWTLCAEIDFSTGEADADGNHHTAFSVEHLWVQKQFSPAANLRAGIMQVPVSGIINSGTPLDFFGVFMPLGESTLLPDTWLESGLSFLGEAGAWRYEAMVMPGVDSSRFTPEEWIHASAESPLDVKSADAFAGAVRVDNTSVQDLRLSLSGYAGQCFNSVEDTRGGSLVIGSFDFDYRPLGERLIARGGLTYGRQSGTDADASHNAFTCGAEAGYDVLGKSSKLYVFGRYDYMHLEALDLNRGALGINYMPIQEIVLKCEYSVTRTAGQTDHGIAVAVGFSFES